MDNLKREILLCPLCRVGVVNMFSSGVEPGRFFGEVSVPKLNWSCSTGCEVAMRGTAARKMAKKLVKKLEAAK